MIQLFYPYMMLSIVMLVACTPVSVSHPAVDDVAIYTEKHRPQYHFSPQANWMNDPNGLVYFEGEYHLFYQYYPDSTVWGPMHWGHAVSEDLIRWQHLPIALYPDELGYIFSGSVVIDWDNTSGFGTEDSPAMVAIFTHHNAERERIVGDNKFQYQSIAYSTDRGRSWTKYQHNPVIANPGIRDFRDPKVTWIDDQWVMVLSAADHIRFYTSPDLRVWKHVSNFGPGQGAQGQPWECPDIFALPADDGDTRKYVLIVSIGNDALQGGSGTQYFVGTWDGSHFVSDHPPEQVLWMDSGKDNYAGVTWSDIPDSDGRRLFIGWMSNWQYAQVVPTEKWRSAMTLPRTLALVSTTEGYRVTSTPVQDLKKLRIESKTLPPQMVSTAIDMLATINNRDGLYELEVTITPGSRPLELVFSDTPQEYVMLSYDRHTEQLSLDRNHLANNDFDEDFAGNHIAPVSLDAAGNLKLHIFIDHSSIEVFAQDGLQVMTDIFFPQAPLTQIAFRGYGAVLVEAKIHVLQRIWQEEDQRGGNNPRN